VTPLTFTKVPSTAFADIEIKFARGYHGDAFPFDGPGTTLAHAFFPRYGGDAHFDDDDYFTHQSRNGVDLFQVVAHELGHSLGLGHSSNSAALMAPFYRGYVPNFKLSTDDISGIQRLYGANTGGTTTTRRPTTTRRTTTRRTTTTTRPTTTTRAPAVTNSPTNSPTDPPAPGTDLCSDGAFDAVTVYESGIYIFRGSVYSKIGNTGMEPGYPRDITTDWQGLPSNIDTALHWPAIYSWRYTNGRWVHQVTAVGRTYFFKDSLYWRFDENRGLLPGYPKRIDQGFPGLPNNLDAAYVWSGNDRIYFWKGDQYYRYTRGRGVDRGYPRSTSAWTGLPSTIDDAFQYLNGKTYFFTGAQYYRYNDRILNIDNGYPRDNKQWWLGCRQVGSQMIGALEMSELVDDDIEDIETVSMDRDEDESNDNGNHDNGYPDNDNQGNNNIFNPSQTGGSETVRSKSVLLVVFLAVFVLLR